VLHRVAQLVAGATFLLVIAGASVTSTGSGLAVPDWPLSYGTLFPRMEGGVLYEHGHRMIAGAVLVMMTVLTILVYRREGRVWVRRLALAAMLALLAQAVLGGLTVLHRLPTAISVGHALLANLFFALTVSLTLFTSPRWRERAWGPASVAPPAVRRLAIAATGAIYGQILLGAVMRHTGAGLAIPDFPLAYGSLVPPLSSPPVVIHFVHRLGAIAVSLLVIALVVRVVRAHPDEPGLRRPATLLAGTLLVQLLLGALAIWTRRAPVATVAHVAVGSAMLATSLVIALRAHGPLAAPVEEPGESVSAAPAAVAS
jgi:cytochrome c oxidase assembly protein subunit 15